MRTPLTVRSTMKPCSEPSTNRTPTGAAAAGCGGNTTVTRASKQSIALMNDMTVESEICALVSNVVGKIKPVATNRITGVYPP